MKKKKEHVINNTKIVVVFFVFLAFIVGISLILKAIVVIKASQFDNSKRFTLSLTNGKNIEVISLSPRSKDVVVFKFNNNVESTEVGRLLEIPIDGFIIFKSQDLNQKIDLLFKNTVFNYNNLKTNLTIIDLFKLAVFTRTIPENSINVTIIKDTNRLDMDKAVERLAIDTFIEDDHQTIKIVNGTEVIGLGNRLARFMTNMGGNVIMVATESNKEKKSFISYIGKKTYTVDRLQKILGYEVVKNKDNTISDITIMIGEDKLKSIPF